MNHLGTRKAYLQLGCLLGADILLFGGTNPKDIPSYMLIVGFMLLSLTIYFLLKGLVVLLRLAGFPIKHTRRLLTAGTALFSGCMALQSIGQLSFRDALVLCLLICLLYVYIAYAKAERQNVL